MGGSCKNGFKIDLRCSITALYEQQDLFSNKIAVSDLFVAMCVGVSLFLSVNLRFSSPFFVETVPLFCSLY